MFNLESNQQVIQELILEVETLRKENQALREENVSLRERARYLEEKLNTNSKNSSKSPSL